MKILIASDVFPPVCGGSGWSAYYLGKALAERGHEIRVVKLTRGLNGLRSYEYGGLSVRELGLGAPRGVGLPPAAREEIVFWRLRRLLRALLESWGADVVHGQHVLTIPAAASAASDVGIPAAATVRDYWPVCFLGSALSGTSLCLKCSPRSLGRCMAGKGAVRKLAAPASWPYVSHILRRRGESLRNCARVVAVSDYVRGVLIQVVPPDRIEVVPNLVDVNELASIASASPSTPVDEPFLLYVGKLEKNKGAAGLVDVLKRLDPAPRTLVVGDGGLSSELERACREHGLPVEFRGWVDHDETLRLMARAGALIFPSLWPEPLSRVLLEAMAVGAVVVAQPTGGTAEIVKDSYNGLLAVDSEGMAAGIRAVLTDPALRASLSQGARSVATERYSKEVVAGRMEDLYRRAVADRGARRDGPP